MPSFFIRAANAHKCQEKLRDVAFRLEDIQREDLSEHRKVLEGVALMLVREIIENIQKEELMG